MGRIESIDENSLITKTTFDHGYEKTTGKAVSRREETCGGNKAEGPASDPDEAVPPPGRPSLKDTLKWTAQTKATQLAA